MSFGLESNDLIKASTNKEGGAILFEGFFVENLNAGLESPCFKERCKRDCRQDRHRPCSLESEQISVFSLQ